VPPAVAKLIPVQKILEDVLSLIKRFSYSTARRDAYVVAWRLYRVGQRLKRLISPVVTRWNSYYWAMMRYCECFTVLQNMTYADLGFDSQAERDTLFARLAAHNLLMSQVLKPLEVICYWTERMSASLSVTISLVPRAYNEMLEAVKPSPLRTDQGVKDFYLAVQNGMETRFEPYVSGTHQRLVMVAQFLDVRTTFELNKDDEDERNDFLEGLRESLSHDLEMPAPKDADPSLPSDDIDSKRARERNISKITTDLKYELEDFYSIFRHKAKALDIDADPLSSYWRLPGTMARFPLLAQMASYYLAAQASEAECERLASSAGLLLTARRRKMGGPLAEKALFAYMAAKELQPSARRAAVKRNSNRLDNALHLLRFGVPIPQPAAAAAPVIVVDGDGDDDIIDLGAGEDEGDLQNDALDAGVELAEDGTFDVERLVNLIDSEEVLEKAAAAVAKEEIEEAAPAGPSSAAAAPVRRSARQAAALNKLFKKFES
jgi:hypothetical protein